MSGIWGFALSEPGGKAGLSALTSMATGGSAAGSVHSVEAGPAAFATQEFPHRTAAVARTTDSGALLAICLHGSIFNVDEWAPRPADPSHLAASILDRYVREGTSAFSGIRGEFAIAIWDERDQSVRLICDRFRVHPLFYYADHRRLVFASRLRMIPSFPDPIDTEIDPDAVVEVLTSSVIPTPYTIYRKIRKLPPGTVLTYRAGNVSLETYWDVQFAADHRTTETAMAEQLREKLASAIQSRLSLDGDGNGFGAFLSGGIDSSTVAGLLTRLSGHPIQTFSIGFDLPGFNEINYARIAAARFGSNHHEYFVRPSDVAGAIPILLDAYDEPFGNASSVPTYYCAKMAKDAGVSVLYAGDGGDELFAGNERYAVQRLLDYYHKVPVWLREPFLVPAVRALAVTNAPLFVKGAKYVQRARIPYPDRLHSYGLHRVLPIETILEPELLSKVCTDRSAEATIARFYRQAKSRDELDRQLYVDLKLAICDNDLFKVTRATEAVGVAVRYPFLDHLLVEFAGKVPATVKMRGTQLRTFFKRAYAELLPPETLVKTKHGFGLPIPVWLRTEPELNAMMQDLVLGRDSRVGQYFRRSARETIVDRHRNDTTSYYGTFLWNIMILELWLRGTPAAHAPR